MRALSSEKLLALVHPLDRAISDERARKRLDGEAVPPVVVLRIVRKNGSVRWIQSFNNPIEFRGRPAILSTSIDITERKEAEEAQRAAERRLQYVVASSPAVLFTLQIRDGAVRGISWMSGNVEAMLGYPVSDTLGGDWWTSNVHPDDCDGVAKRFSSEIFTHDYCADEYRFRHRDGTIRWIRSETRLIRDATNQAEEVVGSLSDITERKRLEDVFRQAQKMEAVGHLAGGVAHDFNNLMTVISGYCQMLLSNRQVDEWTREMIERIAQAGERAAKLTCQLLAFSRRTVLAPKVLDLSQVVLDSEHLLRQLLGEDINLAVVNDRALKPVKVDPSQIGHVIMNLAVNARDAMPAGGELRIETANTKLEDVSSLGPEAKPGLYVMLAVTDNGVGMAPEVRARLFEPFFTTKGVGKGTGLGLATVYGIVSQSNGFIAVHSEPGRGAAFKIYFPAAEGPVFERIPSSPVLERIAAGSETILLVEDEEAVRSTLQLALREAGYSVLPAGRGREALQIAAEQAGPIHLLITDVIMPEMGGRELVERLSQLRPDTKVLYMSGYTDDAVVRQGVLDAKVAFLQKPFTLAALRNKVREAID